MNLLPSRSGVSRIRLQRLSPSTSGIIRSQMMQSGLVLRILSKEAAASVVESTWCPDSSSNAVITFADNPSSSTMKMLD